MATNFYVLTFWPQKITFVETKALKFLSLYMYIILFLTWLHGSYVPKGFPI